MLNQDLRDQYQAEGVIVLPAFLDARDLEILTAELARLEALGLFVNSASSATGTSHEMNGVDCLSEVVRALLFSPRIIDVAASLIDAPFALHLATCFLKRARTGLGTRWHADDSFGRELHPRDKAVGMWIAVDEVRAENAPFLYVPGSKRGDVVYEQDKDSNYRFRAVMTPEMEARAVRPTLPAGSLVLFSYDTLHATGDNHTDADRRALSFHFLSEDQFSPSFPLVQGRFPHVAGPRSSGGLVEYGRDHRMDWEALRSGVLQARGHSPARLDEVLRLTSAVSLETSSQITADSEELTALLLKLPLGWSTVDRHIGWKEAELLRVIDGEITLGDAVAHLTDDGDDQARLSARLAGFVGLLRDFGVAAPEENGAA
jgi:ectoine hydroxylase-related dioxygenase (phytanoyl-CoA dioxygenase family)